MDKAEDKILREQLVNALFERQAHASYEDAVKDFPIERINDKLPNVEYTFWHLLEHIRRSQNDILDFSINKDYEERNWPEDYWPAKDEKADKIKWDKTIKDTLADSKKLIDLAHIGNLFEKFPWGQGQMLLRELIIVAQHTSYHLGAFIIARKTMGIWK
jgi:hypothetical protein